MNMLGMAGIGAGIGAAQAGIFGDNGWGGVAGGALGGAALGVAGPWGAAAIGRKMGIGSLAGAIGTGLNYGRKGALALARKGNASALASPFGYGLRAGGLKANSGLRTANAWVGKNYASINRWGGRALMGMGMMSGAAIGSSILNSNQSW